jgi:5-methylcytosine-specific restriction protein A
MRRRACLHPGCPAVIDRDEGRRYCPHHEQQHRARQDHARAQAPDAHRRTAKAFYDSAAWRAFRLLILSRDPTCRRCQAAEATDVDHVTPLRDAPERALDPSNAQGLCHACHSAKTITENKARHFDRHDRPAKPPHPLIG